MKFLLALTCCLLFSLGGRAEIIVAWGGQSLCKAMFTDNGVYVAPASNTYMWDQSSLSWITVNGAGAREYANMMNAQTGQTIRLINGCVDGSSLAQWMSTASDSPYTWLKNQVLSSGKSPNILQWNQGQSDYGGTSYATYYSGLGWVYSNLLSSWGLTSTQMPMSVWISGRATWGTSQSINAAQLAFATSYPGARLGPAYYDMTYVDGTHVDAASYRIMGDRAARLDLKALGVSGFWCSITPRIIGAWRLTDTLIEVITDSTCGLHTYSGVSSLTGWDMWNANYTWKIPIAAVWLTGSSQWWGTSIIIQTAASTANNVWIYFWLDQYQNPNAPAFSNDSSFGLNGNPVAPLPYGFQTPN